MVLERILKIDINSDKSLKEKERNVGISASGQDEKQ